MNNLEDIREQYYTPEDKLSARCPSCGSYDIGIEQAIKDGVISHYYICEQCGETFL